MKETGYIAGIARGHNAGVCLLKDGEVVFAVEEERLSRMKYDGGPYASILKILEYTDKIDYLFISHTQGDNSSTDYSGDNVYNALCRKTGLLRAANRVISLHEQHHLMHAACAFYHSGFEEAAALVVDGAGTFVPAMMSCGETTIFEVESIFSCKYPAKFGEVYKSFCGNGPFLSVDEAGDKAKAKPETIIDAGAGIVKAYEAVTRYCGWETIEAGKTMGLFPYGKKNPNLPEIFSKEGNRKSANRTLVIPTYPNGATINENRYAGLETPADDTLDLTTLENRRDMAYAVQTESQDMVLDLIRKAAKETGKNKVVISGGYGLNCVANYHYLEGLKDEGIEIYVEPISNDGGTAIGAALYGYYSVYGDEQVREPATSLYLGPHREYSIDELSETASNYEGVTIVDTTKEDIVGLLRNKNIVTMFQGRSEAGPRALGNRSILFDPTFLDGKDYVNGVKHREYFRPFAASVLQEHVHDWFDLRGMDESPHMMYAVNCQDGIAEKIPSVIHVDGTCRIQTVKPHQNPHYHDLISAFHKETGVPLLFNTSFNLGGDPLVETLDDAFNTLARSDIDYMYLPELGKLVTIPKA